jgi:hypothetical protein
VVAERIAETDAQRILVGGHKPRHGVAADLVHDGRFVVEAQGDEAVAGLDEEAGLI